MLVVGGSGGIGAALVRCYLDDPRVSEVIATCYRQDPVMSHARLRWHSVDVCDESQIAGLAAACGQLARVINTVGVLHTAERGPEKTIAHFDKAFFLHSMALNTVPSLLLAKHLAPALKGQSSVFAALSAKVGSIGDNQLGGWYSYRTSKAALNMAMVTLAREWRVRLPQCCVAVLHPGTTDTALSAPFQGNVPADKLFSAVRTARQLVAVIEGLEPGVSGRFWSWDGSELPW